MEVVMGIKPMLPATLTTGLMVEDMDVNEYVDNLLRYLRETYQRVRAVATALEIDGEGKDVGARGAHGLCVGDLVALKNAEPSKGSNRFSHTTDGCLYRVQKVLGENTYAIEDVATGRVPTGSKVANRFAADRLVKLDLPEWQTPLTGGGLRKVEIYDVDAADWSVATVERWAVDGRAFVRFDDGDAAGLWIDLTKCRYRWTLSSDVPADVPAQE